MPAGPAAQSINRLALQSGRQVLFSPDVARGKWTQPVSGELPLDSALGVLLHGTGLGYSVTPGGMILVAPSPTVEADAPLPATPHAAAPEPALVEALVVTPGLAEGPAGVERISAATLDRSVTPGLRDVTRLSSSVNALPDGGGDLKLALRGVYGAGEATAPLYFAGLPISAPSGTTSDPGLVTPDLALVDIDRLDILRGPQGVDHGAGAIGGELRIVPHEPVLGLIQGELSGQVSGTAHGGGGYQLAGMLNAPVGEMVALRGVAYQRRSPGYVDNRRLGLTDTNDDWVQGGRLALKVRPPQAPWSVDLYGLFQRRGVGDGSGWNAALGPYRSDRAALNWTRQQIGVAGGEVRYETPALTLSSKTAWYDWRLDRQLDTTLVTAHLASDPAGCLRYFDLAGGACSADQLASFADYVASRGPSALVQRTSIRALVEELRLEHADAGGRWVAGLFYEGRAEDARSAARVIDPRGAVDFAAGYTGLRLLTSGYQQLAAYAETVRQITPRLSLTAGMRYAATQRYGSSDVLVPNLVSGSVADVPKATRNGGRASGLLRAEYRVKAAVTYAQISTGSRPGGVNTTPDPSQTVMVFRPDSVVNIEVGARRSWFGGALTGEAAAFHIAVHDMQFAANTPNGAFGYVVNIGAARILGAEAALRARRGAFTADLNAAVTDARLTGTEANRVLVRGAKAGDAVPNIPRYRYVATFSWRRPLARGAVLVASWQDEYRAAIASEFRPDDPWYIRSPSYLLDTASVSLEHGPLTMTAALRNVFDVHAVDRALSSYMGLGQTFSATPRTLSLSLRRRW